MPSERIKKLLETAGNKPDDPFVWYALGLEHFNEREYAAAEVFFKKVRADFPNYLPLYLQYAKLLQEMERYPETIVVLDDGIALADKTGESHALKELVEALEFVRQLI